MIYFENDSSIVNLINNNKEDNVIMIFVKGINCSICHAIEARVNSTFPNTYKNLNIHYIIMEENPIFRGQHLIFSTPTLLLFQGNKEIHRESRIIDFTKLNKVLELVLNWNPLHLNKGFYTIKKML